VNEKEKKRRGKLERKERWGGGRKTDRQEDKKKERERLKGRKREPAWQSKEMETRMRSREEGKESD